jgi:TPR repeat protein
VDAQCNLGRLYYHGEGVAQDFVEAARLFRLAAAQGHAYAQFNLGLLYCRGKGVAQDCMEGARHLWLAANQGIAEARPALSGLSGERACVSAFCMGCGATRKLKTCAKCKVARFCGAECVRRAWPEHKPHCKRWAAEAAGDSC